MSRASTTVVLALCGIIVVASCGEISRKERDTITIGIQPFEQFDDALIDTLSRALHATYGFQIHVLPGRPIPPEAFINVKSPRYRGDKIIQLLREHKPDSIDYLLGVTTRDISTTKRNADGSVKEPIDKYTDWGVFGLGYRPGTSCIASTFRIKNQPEKLVDRFIKVCVHELGHNLGLDHCETRQCVMADAAETIKTVDQVDRKLCAACRKKIGY